MTCDELVTAIAELPVDTLGPDEKARVIAHIAQCERCAAAAEKLKGAWGAMRTAIDESTPALPEDGRAKLLERATAVESCTACRGPIEDDAALFGPSRAPYHVECLAKASKHAVARPALSCTFCHDRLSRDGAAFCATCLAPHHDDCFREHRKCAAPGCEETRVVRPATPRRGRWALVAAALVVCSGGAAAAAYKLAGPAIKLERNAREVRLDQSLADAARCCANGSLDVAVSSYEAALVIDPTNDEAKRGLERCRELLAKKEAPRAVPSAPGVLVAPQHRVRAIEDPIGQTKESIVALLGKPVDAMPVADTKWTRLSFKEPTAAVYVDEAGNVIHATFYDESFKYHGVGVDDAESQVRALLGPPDESHYHLLVYSKRHLLVKTTTRDKVEKLVFTETPGEEAENAPVKPAPPAAGPQRPAPRHGAPTDLTGVIERGRVRLSWKPDAENAYVIIDRYDVQRRELPSGEWTTLGTLLRDPDKTAPQNEWVDEKVEPRKRYEYKVIETAVLDEDNSAIRMSNAKAKEGDKIKLGGPLAPATQEVSWTMDREVPRDCYIVPVAGSVMIPAPGQGGKPTVTIKVHKWNASAGRFLEKQYFSVAEGMEIGKPERMGGKEIDFTTGALLIAVRAEERSVKVGGQVVKKMVAVATIQWPRIDDPEEIDETQRCDVADSSEKKTDPSAAPAIDAKVYEIKGDPEVVGLSVGEDDKVEKGFTFTIYRGKKVIAKVVVEKVRKDSCECRIDVAPKDGEKIQVGDSATTETLREEEPEHPRRVRRISK